MSVFNKLKVAVIGLGGQNREDHLPAILENDRLELDSICDSNLSILAEMSDLYKVASFNSLDQLINERKPDLAIVAVPHNQYLPIIEKLVKNKIHILKEKPFAVSLQEAKEIDTLIKGSGIKFMVSVQRRFNTIYTKFEEYKMQIGRIYSIHGHYTLNIPRLDVGWRSSKEQAGGGALIDMGYHIIDLITWYFDLPDTINARLGYHNKDNQNYNVEDTAKVLFDYKYENNYKILGSLLISRIYPNKEEQLTIYGTEGNIEIRKNQITLLSKEKEVIESFTSNKSLAVKKQINYFIDLILGVEKHNLLYEEHFKNVVFIESAYLSDKNDQTQFPRDLIGYTLVNQRVDVIENYFSKIKTINQLPVQIQSQIIDIFSKSNDYLTVKNYFSNLEGLNKDIGGFDQIWKDVQELLLSITGEIENVADISKISLFKEMDVEEFSPNTKNLNFYLQNSLKISLNENAASVIKEILDIGLNETDCLFEKIKGERVFTINNLKDSRVMYATHDFLDHIWLFDCLQNQGLFEKYSEFFESVGNPVNTNIFKREAELISSVGFGIRRHDYVKSTLPIPKISINQIKQLISPSTLSKNQQDALSLLNTIQEKELLDKITYTIYNMSVQIPDERRRWGVIKIKDKLGNYGQMKLLEPEYLAFIIEAVYFISKEIILYRDAQLKFSIVIEEFLNKAFYHGVTQTELKYNDIINYEISKSKLNPDVIEWIKNNQGFSTFFY